MRPYSSNIIPLYLIRFFTWMHFFAAVLVPFYTQWAGLTLADVFFVNAWFFFWNFVLESPTGVVADYLGRRMSLAVGSLFAAGAALVYISMPNFYVFLGAEILFAFAYTLHSGADEALAYDSLVADGIEHTSKQVLSNLESAKLAGIMAGAVAGGWMAEYLHLTAPMALYTIPALLAFALSFLLRRTPDEIRQVRERTPYLTILREGAELLLRRRVLLLLTVELALTHGLFFTFIWLYQPVLAAAGVGIQHFGIVHAGASALQILVLSTLPAIETGLGSKRRFLVLATMFSGVCLFTCGLFWGNPWIAVPGIVIGLAAGFARLPVFVSYMNKYIPSNRRATTLSLAAMARTFMTVLVNPIVGIFAEKSAPATLLVLGGLLITLPFFSQIEENHLLD